MSYTVNDALIRHPLRLRFGPDCGRNATHSRPPIVRYKVPNFQMFRGGALKRVLMLAAMLSGIALGGAWPAFALDDAAVIAGFRATVLRPEFSSRGGPTDL